MSHTTHELAAALERRRSRESQHQLGRDLVVGKDILELLSTAMYLESLTIFREYVQNAVDAIDEALTTGLLSGATPGEVSISLDPVNREIRIRDNGVGVANADAERVLTAFGASRKRGTTARGFRGVGRLAALGYAQSLTFRTKAAGDPDVVEVRWDCRRLKSVLLDPAYKGDLAQVVREIVTIGRHRSKDLGDHFFEVHLDKVIRIRNDVLLNEHEVRRYLSQVAPAPFHPDFEFAHKISAHLEKYVMPSRARITINGGEHLTRPFRRAFAVTQGKGDSGQAVRLVEIGDGEGGVRAVGWLLEHSYLGAIQSDTEIRGLRARVGDVQIGGEDVFAEIFPEPRFNSWTIGELHILDRRVVPNGRRDNFEQNSQYFQLVSDLAPLGRDIARSCRVSSAKRNRIKGFNVRGDKVEELLETLEQGALSRSAEASIRREIGGLLAEMDKLVGGELIIDDERKPMSKRLSKLRRRLEVVKVPATQADPLRGVHPRKRAVYEEVIGLIYECSVNRVAAKALVDRLVARLSVLK